MNKNLLLLTFFIGSLSLAQEKIPFIDYEEVYEKVRESAKNEDYEKALVQLNAINANDSTYCASMVSKSYYLLRLSKYDEAIAVTDKGLELSCFDVHNSFYINKVVALLRQERYSEAIQICEEGLERFPQNKTLWYNKGVALESQGKIEEATAIYKHTIRIDPLYRKAYLQLGNSCYRQDLIGQALLCFNMYLLLQPDADDAFNSLKSLNDLVQNKNENTRDPEIAISEDDDSFEEIDLILRNKIALNEKYETGNAIDIALTRQNHALLQSLKGYSGGGGFWDTRFVPFFQWINNKDYFDIFSYTLCYSIENETYKKVVEKNEKEIGEFFELARNKWQEIVRPNWTSGDNTTQKLAYFYEDGYLKGIGAMEGTAVTGPWELFNANGRRILKGTFNANSEREGEWTWYNREGEVSETAYYVDGKLNGANVIYYENGRVQIKANYNNDALDGEYRYYNEQGALQQAKYFKSGELEGRFSSYQDVGEDLVKGVANYSDGKITEKYVEYFPTGTIRSEMQFKDGKVHGREIQNYLNGKVSTDLNNVNGLADGYYKTYYTNGVLKESGQTTEGYYSGQWQTFYSDGTLESTYQYDGREELDGEYKVYDRDGKLYYVYEYRKGEFIAYKFYNKAGEVIAENRKKGGEFYYKGLSPLGVITTEGLYDIKGGKKGVWKYYSKYGNLNEAGEYQDNKVHGPYTTYYANGKVQSETTYQNDSLNGYYVNYHRDGAIKRQGWYKDNEAHGEWKSYAPDGTLLEINFYHKGKFHGKQHFFSGKGVKTGIRDYAYDEVIKDISYSPEGEVVHTVEHRQDAKNYTLVYTHLNNKPSSKQAYVNGIKHGPYEFFDYYGRKKTTGQYLNGQLHGEWVWYHDNGNVETRANYLNGELDREYTFYFEDGALDTKYTYSMGKLEGSVVSHYENGIVSNTSEYRYDTRYGKRETYSPEGKLQLLRFYDNDRLIGYSYLDKSGEEVPMIPIENETGKVTTYYDNGNISREMEYKNGNLINDFKEYYYTGQLLEEAGYVDGEYDGKRIEYYSNGSIKLEETYEFGTLHGVAKTYYEDGNLKKEQTYHFDTLEGVSTHYDEGGKVTRKETYFDGKITDSTSK